MTPDFLEAFDFFTGVPDSQLQGLCNYLMDRYGLDPRHHMIAANEGNAAAIAAGYHLATGKAPVVYLQNSGLGNIVNPAASLLHEKVYGIPCLFIVGWRGEPNVHDEPQHIFQGQITLPLLEALDMRYFIIDKEMGEDEAARGMKRINHELANGRCAAIVVRKGALKYDRKAEYANANVIIREDAIRLIADAAGGDPIVSTTGKASRELFEIREQNGQGHECDFLTVGSMGHSSSIALGIALHRPETRVWCIDGDGAALMHLGALAAIGSAAPSNLVHIVLNNEAHESVGGQPTAGRQVNLPDVASACGYAQTCSVASMEDLEMKLRELRQTAGPAFIEIKCALGSRPDLGRPTTTPLENRKAFMSRLLSH